MAFCVVMITYQSVKFPRLLWTIESSPLPTPWGHCKDRATAVVGEADIELTCVTLIYRSSGPICAVVPDFPLSIHTKYICLKSTLSPSGSV